MIYLVCKYCGHISKEHSDFSGYYKHGGGFLECKGCKSRLTHDKIIVVDGDLEFAEQRKFEIELGKVINVSVTQPAIELHKKEEKITDNEDPD